LPRRRHQSCIDAVINLGSVTQEYVVNHFRSKILGRQSLHRQRPSWFLYHKAYNRFCSFAGRHLYGKHLMRLFVYLFNCE
jgi:hypothetical protein